MRASLRLFGLIAIVAVVGCVEHTPSEALRPNPPAPSHPRIEGRVKSVSSADIREVIRLKQQDMVKEYGRVLPIYTVRVHSKDHIEVQYWGADGIEYWRDAHRVKGKWKFDALVLVTISGYRLDKSSWQQPI
jgi:hypothetical protein